MKAFKQTQSFITRTTLALVSLLAITVTANAQTLEWGAAKVSNPNGSGEATTDDSIVLKVNGGTDKNSSLVHIGTSTTYSDLNFLSPEGEGVKFIVSGLNLTGNLVNSQLLYFTLTPDPSTLPYSVGTALSLQLHTTGAIAMGWRADSTKKGWPSREQNDATFFKTPDVANLKFTGFELTLTSTNYELIVYTRLNGVDSAITQTGLHGITEEWGNLGINLTLQKTNAGETTWATATINELRIEQIPEPNTVALLAGITLFAWGASYLRITSH